MSVLHEFRVQRRHGGRRGLYVVVLVIVKVVHVSGEAALGTLLVLLVQLPWLGLGWRVEQILLGLVLLVRLHIERGEHVEEGARVQGEEHADAFGESAVGLELDLRGVRKNDHELHLEME